jgi:hypothetical protein
MVETLDVPEDDAITREQYYKAAGMAAPNGNGATGRCGACGKPLVGPRSKRWCSEACRRAYRNEHAAAPTEAHDLAYPDRDPSGGPGLLTDEKVVGPAFAELVGVIVERWTPTVATLTIETASGLSVRIGRAATQ